MNDPIPQIHRIINKWIRNFNILDLEMLATHITVALAIVGVETLHLSSRDQCKIVKLVSVFLAEYIQQQTQVRLSLTIIAILT